VEKEKWRRRSGVGEVEKGEGVVMGRSGEGEVEKKKEKVKV
jgi:hypothetical protein